MDKTTAAILEQALTLPAESRVDLADSLLASLPEELDEDIELAWSSEVQKRIADLDSGAVSTEGWPEIRERLRRRLSSKS